MRLSASHLTLLLLPLALVACRKAQVEVYDIPKESPATAAAMMPASSPHPGMPGVDDMTAGNIQVQSADNALTWTVPATWRQKPGSSVRKGSYAAGPESSPADCAVTAFPGDVGGDLANVNRWLAQMQQPPVSAAALADLITPLPIAGLDIRLVDLTGGTAENPERMLGAIVPVDDSTWFFKLVGPDAVVQAEREAFLAMIRSIQPAAPTPTSAPAAAAPAAPAADDMTAMANTAVRTADGPGLQWTAPAGWQSEPASAMRKATYRVTGAAGATAELAVTAFPGDVGGELANVNRWRNQLGLAPLSATELTPAVTRLTVNRLEVSVVDFTNAAAAPATRLLGAIVPFGEATWFFKFTGPPELLEAEKAAFFALVQSLHNS
jgi:hypothetical protein